MRDSRGERRKAKGQSGDTRGERGEAKGEMREARGKMREARREIREARGEMREARGEMTKARGEMRRPEGRTDARGQRGRRTVPWVEEHPRVGGVGLSTPCELVEQGGPPPLLLHGPWKGEMLERLGED